MYRYALTGRENGYELKEKTYATRQRAMKAMFKHFALREQVQENYEGVTHHVQFFTTNLNNLYCVARVRL